MAAYAEAMGEIRLYRRQIQALREDIRRVQPR